MQPHCRRNRNKQLHSSTGYIWPQDQASCTERDHNRAGILLSNACNSSDNCTGSMEMAVSLSALYSIHLSRLLSRGIAVVANSLAPKQDMAALPPHPARTQAHCCLLPFWAVPAGCRVTPGSSALWAAHSPVLCLTQTWQSLLTSRRLKTAPLLLLKWETVNAFIHHRGARQTQPC